MIEQEIDDLLDPILMALKHHLVLELSGELTEIYLSGSVEMLKWARRAGLAIQPYEGPPMQQAIKYAEQHCAKLVTQMDEETKRQLAKTVSNAIEKKRGIPGLRSDLRGMFSDMTKARADMIARTETADALEQAFMDRAKEYKVTGKRWVTFNPCEICEANEAEGDVPLDHVFSSGDTRPPAHPRCRCSLAPVLL
jgi:hypothetical protein